MNGVWLNPSDISYTRLDSEFYHPEHVEHEQFIHEYENEGVFKVVCLADISKLKAGPFGSKLPSSLYRRKGIPLFRSQNVVPFFPQRNNLVFLDSLIHSDLKSSEVLPGQLLMSKAGRVGDTCLITNEFGPSNITEHVMGIKPNDQVDPYYLVTALNAAFSKNQARRFGLGTLINYLGVEVTRTIRLILPSKEIQHAIGNKIRKAERLRILSNELNKRNVYELNNYLGPFPDTGGSNNFSWIPNDYLGKRIDADYYSPKIMNLVKQLSKNNDICILGSLVESIQTGSTPNDVDVSKGVLFFPSGAVSSDKLNCESAGRISINAHQSSEKSQTRPWDILVAKDGNTIGHLAVVPAWINTANINEHLFCIRLNESDLLSMWIHLFLTSPWGNMQIKRESVGSAQAGLPRDFINRILVPVPRTSGLLGRIKRDGMESLAMFQEAKEDIIAAESDIEAIAAGSLDVNQLLAEGKEIESWLKANPIFDT